MSFPTISSFIDPVRWNLGNRTDIDDRITGWIKQAYREIAMGFPLETLEQTESGTTAPGVSEYSYPQNARGLKAFVVFVNNQPIPLVPKNIEVIRRYQSISRGVPSIFCGFNDQAILRPVPNGVYPFTMDYWQKPNINADETVIATINSTEVMLPDDWFEVLEQMATQKGHVALEEFDKASAVRQILNGDPDSSKGWPGMIKERTNRVASENVISNFGLRPRIRRYTSGR